MAIKEPRNECLSFAITAGPPGTVTRFYMTVITNVVYARKVNKIGGTSSIACPWIQVIIGPPRGNTKKGHANVFLPGIFQDITQDPQESTSPPLPFHATPT
jgi:hypothetical protein